MAATRAMGSTSPVTLDAPVTATSAAGRAAQLRREGVERRGDGGPPGHDPPLAPRQQVGVVLDVEADDLAGHRARQQVEGVGGVAGEHDDVVGPGAEERPDRASRAASSTAVHTWDA